MRILTILFSILYLDVCAQENYDYYPVQFGQYLRHAAFINPAFLGKTNNFEAVLGSKNHLGNFSSISTYFAGFYKSIKNYERVERPYHIIGLKIDTDREGKYIARNRVYAVYAFRFRLSGSYYLTGGIDAGGLNLSVKGTPSTGDKSEYVPDANSGIWLQTERFDFGISVNQIFNGKLQPYQELSILRRHFNVIAARTFNLSKNLSVKPSVLLRFPAYISYNADYSTELTIFNVVSGISLRRKLGAAFWLGIKDINLPGGNLEAVVTYTTPLKRSLININSLEIMCAYVIN